MKLQVHSEFNSEFALIRAEFERLSCEFNSESTLSQQDLMPVYPTLVVTVLLP